MPEQKVSGIPIVIAMSPPERDDHVHSVAAEATITCQPGVIHHTVVAIDARLGDMGGGNAHG